MTENRWRLPNTSERMQRVVLFVIIALVIVVLTGIGLASSTDSAQTVFWAAVKNSMSATAVTIQSKQSQSGTNENVYSQLDFGQHPIARTLTTLTTKDASAETETLTTPTAEYTRYDAIHKKTTSGKAVNFSSVVGLWAKTASYSSSTVPPEFSQVLLDQLLPLPLGNLTAGERTNLMQQIQDGQIYTVNFSSAKKTTYQGRAAYSYAVSIQPVLYLQLIKNYAPYLDMHQLDQLNPNSYGGEAAVSATWVVDAHSKELVKADYGGGRVQTYDGWDVPITTTVPSHPVSTATLQKRLNAAL